MCAESWMKVCCCHRVCVCVWVGGLLLNATEWVECVQTSRNVTCQPVCRALLWRVQPRYESYLTWEWWRDATGRHLRIIDSINLTWPSFAQRNKIKIKKGYNSGLWENSTHALNETPQTHRPKQNKAPKLCQTFVFLNSDFTSDYRQHTDVHGRLRISFPLSLSCSALNSAELILRLIKSTLKSSLCRTQCFFPPPWKFDSNYFRLTTHVNVSIMMLSPMPFWHFGKRRSSYSFSCWGLDEKINTTLMTVWKI